MPSSSALSMIAKLSASLVCGPKFIVPRHSRLTCKLVRPRCVYSMAVLLSLWCCRTYAVTVCYLYAEPQCRRQARCDAVQQDVRHDSSTRALAIYNMQRCKFLG